MIPIIKHSERKESFTYSRNFDWRNEPGSGFGFDCDERGNIIEPTNKAAHENLRKCLSGEYDVVDLGVRQYVNRWTEPAIGKCHCGREVELSNALENECACGRLFNMSGQELRANWKRELYEETGELI